MQYSTLRVSALVAIFSASTALAYLDCGGGRAPPKTTVPGCPGYVGPTSVASTSLPPVSSTVASSGSTDWDSEDLDSEDSDSEEFTLEDEIINQFIESTGVNDGLCQCSGYLCEFARPGCVSINKDGVRSTITANPGYQSKTFNINAFSSYTALAGAGMYYSADGEVISFPAGPVLASKTSVIAIATSPASTSSHSHGGTVASSTAAGASSTITGSPTGQNTTMATATATANSTLPAGNTTVPPLDANGASRPSALSSLAIILGLGMGAMAWL